MTHRNLHRSSLDSMLRAVYRAPHERWLAGIAGALSAFAPALALANPSGGQVVAGSATIGSAGSNGVVINQSSQRAAINWQQFSIGANEYVQFNQPNSSSVVLNRVTGSNPSSIFGSIRANGQVFLINPNGILFAPGSSLDVSGLTASTLDISNFAFMTGHYVFSRDPGSSAATVVNQGNITVTQGGYVVLQGDYVENDGVIQASTGRVVLAAGGGATLTLDGNGGLIGYKIDSATLARLAGVDNTGSITALGGAVAMTADVANALTATAVNNSGLITAHSVSQQGGQIMLLAQGGDIENSGTLDASATQRGVSGGTVILHGDGKLQLTSTSDIEAGGQGNNGGFIDLSGHELDLKGVFNPGKGGRLLLDPSSISIEGPAGNSSQCSGCEGGVIHTNFIDHELNAGIDLTIIASHEVVNNGATAITATGNGKLSVLIGTTSFNTVAGSLHRITSSIFDNGTPKNSVFQPINGGIINLTGLTINVGGGFVASASKGAVTLGAVTAANINIDGKTINTKNLTATTGNVIVNAFGGTASPGLIHVTGNVKSSNDQVALNANSGSIHVTGAVTAPSNVQLFAKGTGNGHHIQVGGAISGASVTMSASGNGNGGGSINVGNVTAKNFNVRITALNHSSGASSFKVTTGNLTAAKNVTITASGPLKGAAVKTGAITAYTSTCGTIDCNGGNVDIRASHGSVNVTGPIVVTASKANVGGVSIQGRNIVIGGISAPKGSIDIFANSTSSVEPTGVTQTAGTTLTARIINVDMHASYGGAIHLANLTASSSKAPAEIFVEATTDHADANSIVVNGNITVSGKLANGSQSNTPLDAIPVAALLDLQASGSGAAARSIKVTGNINVTAHAGVINVHSGLHSCECGNFHETGTGGLAEVFVQGSGSGGSAQLLGTTTVKGTDAQITVNAKAIKTGALTAVASGHSVAINISRSSGEAGTNHGSFASNNNAGRAVVSLSGGGGQGANTINTGNITVSGKGSASVQLAGKTVTAGNITATASAASGTRRLTGTGSDVNRVLQDGGSGDNPGLFGLRLTTGTYTAGRADVFIAGSNGSSSHSHPAPAQSIKVGNVSVTGVGVGDVNLTGALIQTGSINAIATGGSMKGTFTSSNEAGAHHQSFTFKNEGEANVQLDTGTGSHTAITVTGGISAKGPTANINLDGATVKVSKGLSAIGTDGGQATFSGSGTGGAGSTQKFKGPGPITAVTIGGVGSNAAASINVGGAVSVKGPGIVGIAITGAKIALGGLSASASAVETYKVVDSQNNVNETFTADSAAILVFQTSNGKPGNAAPATINGNVTITALHGNVEMLSQLNVTGQVKITAGGDIASDPTTILSRIKAIGNVTGGNNGNGSGSSGGTPSAGGLQFKLKAAGVSMVAGASIDLTGATVTTPGVLALKAGADIILSGVTLTTGTLAADAGSTIHNGGATGTITTKALALVAGKNINLSSTQINVGSGVLAPVASNAALTAMYADPAFAAAVASDPALLGGLAAAGISPAAPAPNAVFKAGNTLTLGTLNLTGTYLYLQAGSISLLGPVTVPKGAVVQLAPNGVIGTTDAEGTGAAGATLNLNDNGLFNVFPDGITLVLGGAGQGGTVTLGNNGTFNIGSDNLIVDTSGTITGLGNVISTGQVVSLDSLLVGVPPVTAGEIDPTSNTTSSGTGKDKHDQDAGADGISGGSGGSITQDTGTSSVCH